MPMLEKIVGERVDLRMKLKIKDPKIFFGMSKKEEISIEYTAVISLYNNKR